MGDSEYSYPAGGIAASCTTGDSGNNQPDLDVLLQVNLVDQCGRITAAEPTGGVLMGKSYMTGRRNFSLAAWFKRARKIKTQARRFKDESAQLSGVDKVGNDLSRVNKRKNGGKPVAGTGRGNSAGDSRA